MSLASMLLMGTASLVGLSTGALRISTLASGKHNSDAMKTCLAFELAAMAMFGLGTVPAIQNIDQLANVQVAPVKPVMAAQAKPPMLVIKG